MKLLWIVGILTLLQPAQMPEQTNDRLSIGLGDQAPVIVNRTEYSLPGMSIIDLDKLDQIMDEIDKKISREPRNAYIGENGQMMSEQPGQKLERTKFAEQFYAYYYGNGPAAFDAPLRPIYPKVDRELLAHIRTKVISQYVTYFNPRNKNRSHNIGLAAKAINSHVVFPGETFSFNRVVGIRTRDRGYLQAGVIVRGELSEGIGGGICQVSSTLFNAIDRAGLKIKERYSHSRNVPYVRPGRDATVSWGGPDFTFQNQYNQPILIRANAAYGKMFVSVYSSDVIEYKPREVPGMTRKPIPEEKSVSETGSR
ncbi:VanW family protein [Paenibacillus tarimensis]